MQALKVLLLVLKVLKGSEVGSLFHLLPLLRHLDKQFATKRSKTQILRS